MTNSPVTECEGRRQAAGVVKHATAAVKSGASVKASTSADSSEGQSPGERSSLVLPDDMARVRNRPGYRGQAGSSNGSHKPPCEKPNSKGGGGDVLVVPHKLKAVMCVCFGGGRG